MTLEDAIREAARMGRLKGLTLWPNDGSKWQGNSTEDRVGWRVEHDADPVQALLKALGAAPAAPPADDIFG